MAKRIMFSEEGITVFDETSGTETVVMNIDTDTLDVSLSGGLKLNDGKALTLGNDDDATQTFNATRGQVELDGKFFLSQQVTTINWNPDKETLQAIISAISDASVTRQYDIIIPPGRYIDTQLGSGDLTLKPFVNLIGADGGNRGTALVGATGFDFVLGYSQCAAGVNRFSMKNIRFEDVDFVFDLSSASDKSLYVLGNNVVMDSDCTLTPTGYDWAHRVVTITLKDCDVAATVAATLSNLDYQRVKIEGATTVTNCAGSFWDCWIDAVDIISHASSTNGDYKFVGGFLGYLPNPNEADSFLSAFNGSGNEVTVVRGSMMGDMLPGSMTNADCFPIGSEYIRTNAGNVIKYIRTSAGTWTSL